MKLRESEDMRAPLAFLLGRLDFDKEFRDFQIKRQGGDFAIQATPKSDQLPYRLVEFLVTPEHQISRLTVTGQDQSVLQFDFSNERLDARVDEQTFRFTPPAGAQIVDVGGGREGTP